MMSFVLRIRWIWVALVLAAPASAADSALSPGQLSAIGRQIWRNECAGSVDGLTSWNAGEEFPSLGIGHFIWYPAGKRGPFEESWPRFVAFAKSRNANPPALALLAAAPWPNRTAFERARSSAEMTRLRKWLASNVTLQTEFIVQRSRAALPDILAAAPASERARIKANYHKVAASPQGTYALIDYVNFKGEGILPTERYQGRGWGLMQVLGEMRDAAAGPAAAKEFSAAAKRVLSRRIALSPPQRGEKRWETGWHHRCETYAAPLLQ